MKPVFETIFLLSFGIACGTESTHFSSGILVHLLMILNTVKCSESVLAFMLLFFILFSLFLCFRETKGNPWEARLKPWHWIQSREDCLSVDPFLRCFYSALCVSGSLAVCALRAELQRAITITKYVELGKKISCM